MRDSLIAASRRGSSCDSSSWCSTMKGVSANGRSSYTSEYPFCDLCAMAHPFVVVASDCHTWSAPNDQRIGDLWAGLLNQPNDVPGVTSQRHSKHPMGSGSRHFHRRMNMIIKLKRAPLTSVWSAVRTDQTFQAVTTVSLLALRPHRTCASSQRTRHDFVSSLPGLFPGAECRAQFSSGSFKCRKDTDESNADNSLCSTVKEHENWAAQSVVVSCNTRNIDCK